MKFQNQQDPKQSYLYFIIGNSLLAFIILGTVGYLAYFNREQVYRETFDRVNNMSLIMEEAVNSSFGAIEIVLDQIAYEAEKKGSSAELSQTDLNQFKNQIEKIKSLNLNWADADGNLKWNSDALKNKVQPKVVNFSDRAYFKYLKENNVKEVYVTEPLFGKIRKNWVVVMAKGLRSKEGKFLGVAWCSISSDYFIDLKSKINISGKDVFVVATGREPKYLYRFPSAKDIRGLDFIGPKEARDVVTNKAHRGVFEVTSPIDGRKRISAFTRIANLPILIVVGQDMEKIVDAWQRQTITTFTLSLFGIFMSILLSIYFFKSNQSYRRYQMQLVNSSRLVALGEMSGSVAHEINNPLMIITGHIDRMTRILSRHTIDKKELENSMEKIKLNTERISNIILGLRKINNQSETRFNDAPLNLIIEESVGMAKERFRSSGVDLIVETNTTGVYVKVNETQILQVIVNLLNNSFDEIQTKDNPWVKVESLIHRGHVRVLVTDCGNGIPTEVAKNIMSPFFTTKGIGKGTGLGLSISKEIMEIHGGRLWYDSSCTNTRFILELPMSESKEVKLSA